MEQCCPMPSMISVELRRDSCARVFRYVDKQQPILPHRGRYWKVKYPYHRFVSTYGRDKVLSSTTESEGRRWRYLRITYGGESHWSIGGWDGSPRRERH